MSSLPNTLVCSRCHSIMNHAGPIRESGSHLYLCNRCVNRRHELLPATVRRTGALGFGFLTIAPSGSGDIHFEHIVVVDRNGQPLDGVQIAMGDQVLVELAPNGRQALSVWWLTPDETPAKAAPPSRNRRLTPPRSAYPPHCEPRPRTTHRPASCHQGGRLFGTLTALKANDWGFVTGDDGVGYFIHISDVGGAQLYEGMRLEFLPAETPRGRKVSHVRVF